jgi:hypothetical protein
MEQHTTAQSAVDATTAAATALEVFEQELAATQQRCLGFEQELAATQQRCLGFEQELTTTQQRCLGFELAAGEMVRWRTAHADAQRELAAHHDTVRALELAVAEQATAAEAAHAAHLHSIKAHSTPTATAAIAAAAVAEVRAELDEKAAQCLELRALVKVQRDTLSELERTQAELGAAHANSLMTVAEQQHQLRMLALKRDTGGAGAGGPANPEASFGTSFNSSTSTHTDHDASGTSSTLGNHGPSTASPHHSVQPHPPPPPHTELAASTIAALEAAVLVEKSLRRAAVKKAKGKTRQLTYVRLRLGYATHSLRELRLVAASLEGAVVPLQHSLHETRALYFQCRDRLASFIESEELALSPHRGATELPEGGAGAGVMLFG